MTARRRFAWNLLDLGHRELWYAALFATDGDLESAKRCGSNAVLALKGALSHA